MQTSKKLVSVFAKSETMNSYDFWKVLNNIRESEGFEKVKHNHFQARVIDEIDDLPLGKSFTPSRSNHSIDTYELNKDQMLLIGMRESKTVRKQVLKWLHELSDRVNQLEQEKINRASASLNYVEQNKILHDTRKAEGKETEPYHYSNEANLINRVVLGCTAKAYRIANDFDKTVNLRDTLSIVELECVASLESTNKELIKIGMEYTDRKEMLLKVFKRDLASKLIDEQMRLEA
jgi:hypothetical protein